MPPVTHFATTEIDWSGCPVVEINPHKVSGAPIVRGTRVQASALVENFADGSPIEEISENFAIPVTTIQSLLTFARRQRNSAL